MLDSGVLDDSDSGRSIRDVGGRTVFVSLRGLAEAGRLVGEGEMRKQSPECKNNDACICKENNAEQKLGRATAMGILMA
jgi:hypothetical protein